LDPSAELLAQAVEIAEEQNVSVTWMQSKAEDTGLNTDSFDIVTAGQCWHWFDAPKALLEINRVLREDGRLIIAHFDWVGLPGNVVDCTIELVNEMNPGWFKAGGTGIYSRWFSHLSEGGFRDLRSYSFDESVSYSHEAWRGRMRASAGVGGSMSPDRVEEFDQRLGALLHARFPNDPLHVPHRVFVVHGKH